MAGIFKYPLGLLSVCELQTSNCHFVPKEMNRTNDVHLGT